MKITCSRRDDLMRARYDYDEMTRKYESKVGEGEKAARFAKDEVAAHIENAVRSALGPSDMDLRINVDTDWNYVSGRENYTWRVSIEAHENDKRSNDATALAWNWSAKLDIDGNVMKESGSWSGLQAVTPEQIDDLQESVRILRQLNDMDWASILNQAIPSYNDYIDKEASSKLRDLKSNRPDFDRQILEADVEDAIESGAWIKLQGRPGTDYYREASRGDYWCKIDSMTPKFVKCHITREYEDGISDRLASDERIGKDKLFSHIVKPVETRQS